MNNNGYIKLFRKCLSSGFFNQKPFDKWHAWEYLLLHAKYKDGTEFVNNRKIDTKRGCVYISQDNLAKEWGWSKCKVLRFISILQNEGMVILQKNHTINCISIVSYDMYQGDDTTDDTTDKTTNDTTNQTTEKENDKEKFPLKPLYKEKEKESNERITLSEDNVPIKKSAAKKRSSSSASLVTKCRRKFEDFFQRRYSEPYYWTGVDGKATKELLNKLKFSRKSHTPPMSTDDDSMVDAFDKFIKLIDKGWLFDNFDLKTINSQYNKIVASYRNPGKNSRDNYTSLKDPMAVEHSGDTSENYFKKKIIKDPFEA